MAVEFKDYYAILGLKKTASADEIKQAYRRLARQHHPDLHPEAKKKEASDKFKEINEAYEVLSDPEKRKRYDALGPDWERGVPPPSPGGGGRAGFREARPQDFEGFSDFFETMFGAGARGDFGFQEAPPRSEPGRGQDIEAELPLSLEDAFRGGEKRLTLPIPTLCPSCGGSGRQGRGFCPNCGGVGEVQRERTITAHLPRHVRDGSRLRLRGQGAPAARGQAGDLYLRVRLMPDPRFRVIGPDLETDVTIMPWDAALGGEIGVPTLEGTVRIKLPAGTHAGRRLRVAEHGLRGEDGSRGALFVVVRIDIPERTDARAERLYRELKENAG